MSRHLKFNLKKAVAILREIYSDYTNVPKYRSMGVAINTFYSSMRALQSHSEDISRAHSKAVVIASLCFSFKYMARQCCRGRISSLESLCTRFISSYYKDKRLPDENMVDIVIVLITAGSFKREFNNRRVPRYHTLEDVDSSDSSDDESETCDRRVPLWTFIPRYCHRLQMLGRAGVLRSIERAGIKRFPICLDSTPVITRLEDFTTNRQFTAIAVLLSRGVHINRENSIIDYIYDKLLQLRVPDWMDNDYIRKASEIRTVEMKWMCVSFWTSESTDYGYFPFKLLELLKSQPLKPVEETTSHH